MVISQSSNKSPRDHPKWWNPNGFLGICCSLVPSPWWAGLTPLGARGPPEGAICIEWSCSKKYGFQKWNNQQMCQTYPNTIYHYHPKRFWTPLFFLPFPNPILEKPMNSSCFSHQPKSSDREGTARGWRPPWILDHMSCLFLGCWPGSPGMNTAILTQPRRLDGFFVSVRDYMTNHQSSQITWSSFFWMGWRENLQKRPTCDCENNGFLYINLPLTLHKIS